ncbi:MAG: tripartite tricarboxylate transporter substrate binding protein [Alphaproteobacteria bacterium]
MRKLFQNVTLSALGAAALFATATTVFAAEYPAKPVTFVVPWPAGGSTDITGRMTASYMSNHLGQAIAVVNRVGGVGTIATRSVLDAPKDGYTVLVTTVGNHVLQPAVRDVGFLPRDFIPVGQISARTMLIVAGKQQPYSDAKSLIAHAKANPGKATFASPSKVLPWRAAMKFAKAAGITLKHIPAKGDAKALPMVLGGHVGMASLGDVSAGVSHIKAGTMNAIGVFSAERHYALPDTPTMKELGFELVLVPWTGLAVAKGTPPEIIKKLSDALKATTEDKAFLKFAKNSGTSVNYLDGPAFGKIWDRDWKTYRGK